MLLICPLPHTMATMWIREARTCSASTAFVYFVSILTSSFPRSACARTAPPPTVNTTISVPVGTRNHGDPSLLCTPSQWTDVATFFFANFITHAATVKSVPGEVTLLTALSVIFALFFPSSGIIKALNAIYQHAIFARTPLNSTPLNTATRAGALCMVVRTSKWKARPGDVVDCLDLMVTDKLRHANQNRPGFEFLRSEEIKVKVNPWWGLLHILFGPHFSRLRKHSYRSAKEQYSEIPLLDVQTLDTEYGMNVDFRPSTSILNTSGRNVHGICQLPEGHALSIVPPQIEVFELNGDQDHLGSDDEERGHKSLCRQQGRGHGESVDTERSHRDEGQKRPIFDKLRLTFSRLWRAQARKREKELEQHNSLSPNVNYQKTALSSTYNLPKGLIAIFQLVYASVTLYRVRGDQIQQYGYAAFALTVAPYMVMSIVNLISTLLAPEYPTTYMVRSEVMDEALKREDAKFEGYVGSIRCTPSESDRKIRFGRTRSISNFDEQLELDTPLLGHTPLGNVLATVRTVVPKYTRDGSRTNPSKRPTLLISSVPAWQYRSYKTKKSNEGFYLACASVAVTSISIAINGAFSSFHPRNSTHAQRVWTMMWLAFGIAFAPFAVILESQPFTFKLGWVLYGAPSIGGFVVVGQMLMEYGNCIRALEGNV